MGFRELPQVALYVLFLDSEFTDESADNVSLEPRVEAVVERAAVSQRSDFVRAARLEAGTGDRVTLELVEGGDVATLDFAARMALWAGQEKRKALSLQPATAPAAAAAATGVAAAAAAAAVPKPAAKKAPAATQPKAAPKAAPVAVVAVKKPPKAAVFCGECGAAVAAERSACSVCGEPCA